MALSFDDDPNALLYPGAMPSGYQLPVSSFEDAAQEELFRQAMEPQPIMPADPVPYPDPSSDMLAAATTLGPKGTGPGPTTNPLAIGLRPLGDRIGTKKPPLRIGETGEEPAQEIAGPSTDYERDVTAAAEGGDPDFAIDGERDVTAAAEAGDPDFAIDPIGRDVTAAAEGGDPDFAIDAPPGEALPPPPTETTPANYLALVNVASGNDPNADPERVAHAQRLLGWTDDEGHTARAPELPDEYRSQRELNAKVYGETASENFRREEDRKQQARDEEKRRVDAAREEDIRKREQGYAVIDKARAEARADRERNTLAARELANQKIDPDRWWHTRGTGQKLAALLGAVAGGLVEARGGKNHALPMIMAMIDQDVDAQKADIANKRAALGDESRSIADRLADAETDHRDGELRRQANYQIVRDGITEYMQNFDQRGSQAQNFRKLMQAADAAAIAAADKAEKEALDNKIKIGRHDIAVSDANLRREAADAKRKKDLALAAAASASGAKRDPDYWFNYQGGEANKAVRPPRDMNQKEFNEWINTRKDLKAINKPDSEKTAAQLRKEEADAQIAEANAAAAKTGYAINNSETGLPLTKRDGTTLVVQNDAARNKTQGIVDAAVNIRKLTDKIAEVRKRTGGSAKYLSTDDYNELQSLATAVDFETFVGFGLGAPSEGDRDLAEKIKGGDMTSWIADPKKGLETYASSIESKANTHLKGVGYDGDPVRFHRVSDLKESKGDYIDEVGRRLTTALSAPEAKPGDSPLVAQQKKIASAFTAQQSKETERDLLTLGASAEFSPDLKLRKRSRALLEGLAEKSIHADVRAKIKKILDDLPGGNERTGEAR